MVTDFVVSIRVCRTGALGTELQRSASAQKANRLASSLEGGSGLPRSTQCEDEGATLACPVTGSVVAAERPWQHECAPSAFTALCRDTAGDWKCSRGQIVPFGHCHEAPEDLATRNSARLSSQAIRLRLEWFRDIRAVQSDR